MKLSVFLLLLPLFIWGKTGTPEWEKIYSSKDLSVFRKEIPGYDTFAFRAVGLMKSPLVKVASVLVDSARRKEWMPDVGETWVIKQLNKNERIDYVQIKTPFIIKDREFVLHAKADWDKENRTITFSFESVAHPDLPPSKRIRAELFESRYVLKERGEYTEVEFTVHVDPKGTVPKWLVNLFQKNYPRKTIEGLEMQAKKTDIAISSEVARAMSAP